MQITLSRRSVLASFGLVGFGMLASPGSWRVSPPCDSLELQARLTALETALGPQGRDRLREFLRHMSIVEVASPQDPASTATTIRFTGVNVQIVNGLGATNGSPGNRESINPAETVVNGLGNLIVGYNELGDDFDRSGSHNVIVGSRHQYPSFGGLVAGSNNTISGAYSSVSGGQRNDAGGDYSSISGGRVNRVSASADWGAVGGGLDNAALGIYSSVSGGESNTASGSWSSVTGGFGNTANSSYGSVGGGLGNTASGTGSSVCGGQANLASGYKSSVSGGEYGTATGEGASVSGGSYGSAFGDHSSVSGGGGFSSEEGNQAFGDYSSVSGGSANQVTAAATKGAISGGCSVTVDTVCGQN